MQLPRASTSALADGYCPAIVAESFASVSGVGAVACCAVVCRAGNPAAMKSEMPIAAIKGRALPIASPSGYGTLRDYYRSSAALPASKFPRAWPTITSTMTVMAGPHEATRQRAGMLAALEDGNACRDRC